MILPGDLQVGHILAVDLVQGRVAHAAIVTMRGLLPGQLDPDLAGMILSLPVFLNTLFKAGIVLVTAGWKSGWRSALPLVASAAVIPAVLLLTR